MRQVLLAALVVCAMLPFLSYFGCSRVRTTTSIGGAQGSKAENARKQTEGMASNAVNGAAKSQAKAAPELAKNGKSGFVERVTHVTVIRPDGISSEPKTEASTAVSTTKQPATPQETPQLVAVKDPAAPKSPSRPGSPAVIKVRVSSTFPYVNESDAEDEAFANAQNMIEKRLSELDPPVKYQPSLNEIKREFIRKDSRGTSPPSPEIYEELIRREIIRANDKVVYVEYDVEVTADQVRELRTRDRITVAFRIIAGMSFVALACFLFLQADEWTKGYLTKWLAFAAVAAVGGVVAVTLCFV